MDFPVCEFSGMFIILGAQWWRQQTPQNPGTLEVERWAAK